MSNTRSLSLSWGILAATVGVMIALQSLFGFAIPNANAQALSGDEMFGGELTGEDFAGSAGLSSSDLPSTIAAIIRIALGFLGIVAVIIILIGGFKWMTAGGNDDKVKDAKKLMIAGVIGLVIVLSAYAIASFVISSYETAIAAG